MFERATIFSAIFVLIFFGILGLKYLNFLERKKQVTQTSLNLVIEEVIPLNKHN